MDLTEAEDIKKRRQEYTEELYKKEIHNPDNHNGVITDLEPDILECEVKWALGTSQGRPLDWGHGSGSGEGPFFQLSWFFFFFNLLLSGFNSALLDFVKLIPVLFLVSFESFKYFKVATTFPYGFTTVPQRPNLDFFFN